MTPPALDHAVKACWNHDPNEHRLQTASDLMRELKWIAERTAPVVLQKPDDSGQEAGAVSWGGWR